MDALVFVAAGEVELQELPIPEPVEGETLVRVVASGVCGSELHGFRTVGMRRPPLVMGHEFTGTTPEGDRVVINPLLACGQCPRCEAASPQQCERRGLVGVSRAGGFADYVAVPTSTLVPLPANVGFVEGSLIEPLANAVHASGLLDETPARVGVIGGGTIGLLCAQVARLRGSGVTVSEVTPSRRAVVESMGFVTHEELPTGLDAVIDAVGSTATREMSLTATRSGGTAVWIGLAEPETRFDGNALVRGERRVLGSFAYTPAEFQEAVDLAPKLDLGWCTEIAPADWASAFHGLADGDLGIVKAVLVPGPAAG